MQNFKNQGPGIIPCSFSINPRRSSKSMVLGQFDCFARHSKPINPGVVVCSILNLLEIELLFLVLEYGTVLYISIPMFFMLREIFCEFQLLRSNHNGACLWLFRDLLPHHCNREVKISLRQRVRE